MPYTDRQIERIRARLEAFYDVESRRPRKLTWGGICNDIYSKTAVDMDTEVLRQFVRRVKRRGIPRIPDDENLEGIVSYLTHPDIDLLSREELEDPENPRLLARFLLEFLGSDQEQENGALTPPGALSGSYRALDGRVQRPDRVIDLTLAIEDGDHVIRLSEIATSYSYQIVTTGGVYRSEISQRRESEGWAVLTPEDNLIIFMKAKRYSRNFYYLTLGMDRNVWSGDPISTLLLLRHQYPVQQLVVPSSFDELRKESEGDTDLMCFRRLAEGDFDVLPKIVRT